jgi:hypothetical protein
MTRGLEPFRCFGFELFDRYAGHRREEDILKIRRSQLCHLLPISREHGFEGFDVF